MLFREKLYLANCDSTRQLGADELRKRLLLGLVFADGVIVTPNILLDNLGFDAVLSQYGVHKYLNEEGLGKFVIRGFGVRPGMRLRDYFNELPGNYVISSLPGAPTKGSLSPASHGSLLSRLEQLDVVLIKANVVLESVDPSTVSLSEEVRGRLGAEEGHGLLAADPERLKIFVQGAKGLVSRSQWYRHVDAIFQNPQEGKRLKSELIDPAYNSLFVRSQEAFAQDRMRVLDRLPERLLVPGVMLRALRREIELIQVPIKLFHLITSLGSGELLRYLTDEALNYLEDKAQDKGLEFMTRRNWFGFYPKMTQFVGVEVK